MPTLVAPEYASATIDPGIKGQNITADTPDAFGAQIGAAEQSLGSKVQGLGDVLAKHAEQMQAQDNEAASNDAITNYDIQSGKLTNDFQMLQGKARSDAYDGYIKGLNDLRMQMRGNLPNADVQRSFDTSTSRLFANSVTNGSRQAAVALRQYQSDAAQARISTGINSAARNNDDAQFAQSISADNLTQQIRTDPQYKDASPEVINQLVRDKQSDAWTNRIQTLSYSDPVRAQQLLKANQGNIDPTKIGALEHHVTQQIINLRSIDIGKAATGVNGPTGTQAEKEKYMMQVLSPTIGKIGAAGLVGGTIVESGGLNEKSVAVGDASDGTDSVGIAQHNMTRLAGLKAYANSTGGDPLDFKTQVGFINQELQTTHTAAANALRNASTPEEAALAARKLFEGADPASAHDDRRIANANRLAGTDITSLPLGAQPAGFREDAQKTAEDMARRQAQTYKFNPVDTEDFVKRSVAAANNQFSNAKANYRDQVIDNKLSVQDALYSENGDPPRTMDEFFSRLGAEGTTNFNAMNGSYKASVMRQIQRNHDNPPLTDARQATYDQWQGRLADPDTRPEAIADVEGLNDADLPRAMKSKLLTQVQQYRKDMTKEAPVNAAMRQLSSEGLFNGTMIDKGKNKNAYAQYVGALSSALQTEQGTQGTIDRKRVSDIGRAVLAEVIKPTGFFGGNQVQQGTPQEQSGRALDSVVPDADRQIIQAQAKAKNVTLNPGDLNKVYFSPNYIAHRRNSPAPTPASDKTASSQ